MKKMWLAVLTVLFVTPTAFAADWGLGVKLGAGQNDPKDLKEVYDELGTRFEKNNAFMGFEVFFEDIAQKSENGKIGVKLGLDIYGENSMERNVYPRFEITEETYAVPVTIYYKWDNGLEKVSWFAGAGATIIRTKIKATGFINETEKKSKAFPHIVVGGEYRFTQNFALGLEARYNFVAKIKGEDDAILSDRTGLGAALTGRVYF